MSNYYLRDDDLQTLLKELPSAQGKKLQLMLEPVLGDLVWTDADAVHVLHDALVEREVELSPERFEQLLNLFLAESFECDATMVRVNERLADMASDFLESYQPLTPEHQFSESLQVQ